MYGVKSGVLPVTGTVAFSLMGYQFGVTHVMLAAIGTIATGVVAYRLSTKKNKYVGSVS